MIETSTYAPSTSTHSKPEGAAEVCEESGQFSVQGGSSRPGVWLSPASTAGESAQASAQANRIRLIEGSPLVEVVELGGFAARTGHDTAHKDPALVLFLQLADRKGFRALTRLCHEKLATAPDKESTLRWRKDSAIAEALQGRYLAAREILTESYWLAEGATGTPRGKYENQLGIVLARLGRSSLALERFGLAYQNCRAVGDLSTCARVDHNRARALLTRGETEQAGRYLRRALEYARAQDDFRLELEICETAVEFGAGLSSPRHAPFFLNTAAPQRPGGGDGLS